jgi:hypothetical protein
VERFRKEWDVPLDKKIQTLSQGQQLTRFYFAAIDKPHDLVEHLPVNGNA